MRCAGCKFLRRRCAEDCLLASYFPGNDLQRFSSVHRIFGASNITKMLQQLPVHLRGEAADCMAIEASLRISDPVYGCVAIISQLQKQIFEAENEIVKTRAEIAFHNAQQLVSVSDHHHHNNNNEDHTSSSNWLDIISTSQQEQEEEEQVGSSLLGHSSSHQHSNI